MTKWTKTIEREAKIAEIMTRELNKSSYPEIAQMIESELGLAAGRGYILYREFCMQSKVPGYGPERKIEWRHGVKAGKTAEVDARKAARLAAPKKERQPKNTELSPAEAEVLRAEVARHEMTPTEQAVEKIVDGDDIEEIVPAFLRAELADVITAEKNAQ